MRWRALWQALPALRGIWAQTRGKDWYRSKTIVGNVLLSAAGVAAAVTGVRIDMTPEQAAALAAGIVAAVNIALRCVTHEPVRLRRPPGGPGDDDGAAVGLQRHPVPPDRNPSDRRSAAWPDELEWLDPGD